MKCELRTALSAAVVAAACGRGPVPPPASVQPVSALGSSAAPPASAAEPPATAEHDAAPESEAGAPTEPCETAELDLDALLDSGRCPLPERLELAHSDPDVVSRIDADEIDVAPGGTARVPVVFDNPTARTLSLVVHGCKDDLASAGPGLLGDFDASAPAAGRLSSAFAISVENSAGKRVDEAPGDDIACLSACMPVGVAVRLPPGAHARATLEYRAMMHRWVQCQHELAGPLRRGTYELVVSGGTKQRVKTKLVVRKP